MTAPIHRAVLLTLVIYGMFMNAVHAETPLKSGDRVVFLGDSITQAGAAPGGYVDLFRKACDAHYGDGAVTVIGAGISGHKVPDCQQRLERDVLSKNPSVVVIYIGINDVWHSKNNNGTPQDTFDSGLREMIQRINEKGARVVLCTPSVIGEKWDGSNELDAMLDDYCGISRKVTAETDAELLDLRKLFLEKLKVANPEQAYDSILTTDGVHLNPDGNQFVAHCMLHQLTDGAQLPAAKLLRHVVLFKFQEDAAKDKVEAVVDAFASLPEKIDAIHDFEMGTDVSVEERAKGFTHGFVVTFKTEADRAAYLPHPAHKEFVKLVGPVLDDVLVFDYWANP